MSMKVVTWRLYVRHGYEYSARLILLAPQGSILCPARQLQAAVQLQAEGTMLIKFA